MPFNGLGNTSGGLLCIYDEIHETCAVCGKKKTRVLSPDACGAVSAPTRLCPSYVVRLHHVVASPCPWCATRQYHLEQEVAWLQAEMGPAEDEKAWYLRKENQAFAQRERERQ
ncbi:hypothetical protein Slin15195_G022610 [Septoria linicola]|uniref:Uncharacterized protein n=1 Tax=Septoria linicola TaxID=215465 RepID=A0A9Q9AMW7_9PEZI|nr:hypothetical protein Slin15195_G022610 [Septoria linicola]